jgi:hypothetical protein
MRDWRELYKKYRGQWVALKDDGVTAVASGRSRQEVEEKAAKLGYSDPLVVRLPEELTAFAG